MEGNNHSLLGSERNDLILLEHDCQDSDIGFVMLLYFLSAFFVDRWLVDLEFHEGGEAVEDVQDLLLLFVEAVFQRFDLAAAQLQLVHFVAFYLLDHGLVVQDQIFYIDVLVVIQVAVGGSQVLLLYDGQTA